uniref:Fe2OG dioxygenase domain-containing protein n=1 Tax=Glycine max TaxID=3847 RepID=A0A0R0ITV2_SOYBN
MALSFNSSNSLYDFEIREGNGVKGVADLDSRTCDAPPIDLSKLNGPEHEKVVDEIVRASETLGFFQVVNHGVPLELLESLKDAAHTFFNLPQEKKAVFRTAIRPGLVTKLSMVHTSDEDALQNWPNQCREVALEYLKLSHKMVRGIVKILIKLTVGVGRHSDLGTITALLQDEIGGLYVKMEEENDAGKGEWLEIPPIPGALVINIGDILEILSNGKYKSAEHRTKTTSIKARVSVPLFTLPIATERIGPLPEAVKNDGFAQYREVAMQDYTKNFFGNAHQGNKTLDFARINSA